MTKLLFLGQATLKMEYILYVSKALRDLQEQKVCILTDNEHYITDMQQYEVAPNIEVYSMYDEEFITSVGREETQEFGIVIFDILEFREDIHFNKVFIITDPYKHHIQMNLGVVATPINALIVVDLVDGSKIGERYLRKVFDVETESIILFPLEVKDKAIIIDNGYNESLRMNKFSKDFKYSFSKLVQNIIGDEMEYDEKELKKRMKRVWRNKQ